MNEESVDEKDLVSVKYLNFLTLLKMSIEESVILGLQNAYREKNEMEFETNTRTFVAESAVISKYIQDICRYSTCIKDIPSIFEMKNRLIYIVIII